MPSFAFGRWSELGLRLKKICGECRNHVTSVQDSHHCHLHRILRYVSCICCLPALHNHHHRPLSFTRFRQQAENPNRSLQKENILKRRCNVKSVSSFSKIRSEKGRRCIPKSRNAGAVVATPWRPTPASARSSSPLDQHSLDCSSCSHLLHVSVRELRTAP